MEVIGVIDLHQGRAVHAKGGSRALYQPVLRAGRTRINGNVANLAQFYRETCGLADLYVADLDAIAGGQPQRTELECLGATGAFVWLDAGVTSAGDAHAALATGASRVVVGLETLTDYDALANICSGAAAGRAVLSLDLRDGCLVCRTGSPIATETIESVVSHAWDAGIDTIVVLDLNRVGSGSGPALGEITRVRNAAPEAAVYAGGGIGSLDDLRQLQSAGVRGVLIASALHDGRLTPEDLHPILTR